MSALPVPVLELDGEPASRRRIASDLWQHRQLLRVLARTDFHARYKRAFFGVLWAVAVPLLQAVVLAIIFSKVVHVSGGKNFGLFVLSGIMAWSYFAGVLASASTSVVDGSELATKVWFPRTLLPMVPAGAGLVGLGLSVAILVVAVPLFGLNLGIRIFLLVPGCALLVSFTSALALVLAGMHVYFRDVRYLVQAALLLWFYLTPILYPPSFVKQYRLLLDANPFTGIVVLFHMATVGGDGHWLRPVLISLAWTTLLAWIALEVYRRHDRIFVDRL